MDIRKQFAINLKRLMKENGKRQQDLREELGYSSSTLSQWCSGKFIPRPSRVEKLSKYFGVPVEALYAGEDQATIRTLEGTVKMLEDKSMELAKRLADVTEQRDKLIAHCKANDLAKTAEQAPKNPIKVVVDSLKGIGITEVSLKF